MTRDTERLESVAFTIEPGKLTRHGGSSSRTALRFMAPATRHLDGGFDCSVTAVLFDAQGRYIVKRSGDRSRTVLGNRAVWVHEFENEWLATAKTVTYEIEHRFEYRRKVLAGELPSLPVEADGSDYYRWIDFDPRTLEDRAVRFDFGLWARSSSLEITMAQYPKIATDSFRTEFELDLLDANHLLCFSRPFSVGTNYSHPAYDDTSISMDRQTLRTLRFFELRGNTEARAIAKLTVDGLPS